MGAFDGFKKRSQKVNCKATFANCPTKLLANLLKPPTIITTHASPLTAGHRQPSEKVRVEGKS
jgi:hypothetical protein